MAEDRDALRQEAERFGLTNLSEHHMAQFAKAKAAATRFVATIPRDFPMYVEPAHVFRASTTGGDA
jgi:hypothetical protein